MEDPNTLDATAVAALLGVNKATVYKLVREGTLSSFNVGRKLRFTSDDVIDFQRRMHNGAGGENAGRAGLEAGPTAPESAELLGGANLQSFSLGGRDPILETLCGYLVGMGLDVPRSYRGSYQSLVEVYLGATQAAAIHLWDSKTDTCNIPYIRNLMPGTPCVVFTLARIRQGLIVRQGNPRHIRDWGDLVRDDVTLANREKGSGARVLLDEHLILLEADHYSISGYDRELASSLALAGFVARGGADVGVGSEMAVHQVDGLDFLPQQDEELALVVRKGGETDRVIRLLRGLLTSRNLRGSLPDMPGYDLSRMGRIIYEV